MIVVARPGMGCYAALLRRDGRLFGFWISPCPLSPYPAFIHPETHKLGTLSFLIAPGALVKDLGHSPREN